MSVPSLSPNRFRSSNNQRLLKGLFYEETDNKDTAIYTLKDRDHTVDGVVFPSLYRLYIDSDDLTEYTFATTHLDGWEHWEMLKSTTWFKPFSERWARELEIKVRSKALTRLRAEASSSSKNAFLANKFLIERGWVDKSSKSSVGRPSKEAIKAEADQLFHASREANKDLQRLLSN